MREPADLITIAWKSITRGNVCQIRRDLMLPPLSAPFPCPAIVRGFSIPEDQMAKANFSACLAHVLASEGG